MAYNSKYTGAQVESILDNAAKAVIATEDGSISVPDVDNPSGGSGDGAVSSVNGKTGAVVLKVSDLENDSSYATQDWVNTLVGNVESLLEALL